MLSVAPLVVTLTTMEDPESLTFRLELERGWIEPAVGVFMVFFTFWKAHQWQSLIWLAVGFIAVSGLVANWINGAITDLTVTRRQLVARGNVGRMFSTETRVLVSDVSSLKYDRGGEDSPSGLYVTQGWKHQCILVGASEAQSEEIVSEIYRKFPEIGKGDADPPSLIFGSGSNLTTLGLS